MFVPTKEMFKKEKAGTHTSTYVHYTGNDILCSLPHPFAYMKVSFNISCPCKDIIPPVKICETFSSIFRINIHKQDVAYNINPLLMVFTKYKELIRQLYVGKQVTSHLTTIRIQYQYV